MIINRTKGLIYVLCDPITQEIRYCGKTVTSLAERLAGHHSDAKRGVNRHLCNWLRKLDSTGNWPPKIEVYEEVDIANLTKEQQRQKLNEAEIRWIAQLKTNGVKLLNATIGGDGSHGLPLSKEQKEKIAASNRGQKRSPETRENMRQAQLRRDHTKDLRGERHPHFGKQIPFKDPKGRIAKLSAMWTEEKKKKWIEHVKLTQTGVPKKLNIEDIINIFNSKGMSISALGRLHRVSRDTISRIKNKKRFCNITDSL